ncbi:XdhC family protein [Pelomicrobium methylotrophicum]|nr:XdhC family protein [Pelomicrobium methylotrophicum]
MLESDKVLEKAASLQSQGKPFALATVIRCESPTSAKPGAKALVEPDGVIHGWIGGGCAQPAVIKIARRALEEGQPYLIRISPERSVESENGIMDFGMTCHSGGTLDIFVDPIIPRPGLLVLGASPAAQALAALAKRVGFQVLVAFPGATRETFPEADQILDGFDMAAENLPAELFVVVATQGKKDEEALETALGLPAQYVAFIASRRKAEKLKAYLLERGHNPTQVNAIAAPAGIDIGAVTPEEVALSVLAGVVQARRVSAMRSQDKPVTLPLAVDPVCHMTVDIATAEYTHLHQGQTYYFCCKGCREAFAKTPEKYLVQAETGV